MVTNFGAWDMDITALTMIITARLSSLGFCYKDGGETKRVLSKDQEERKIT
jgi:hypothetical protein